MTFLAFLLFAAVSTIFGTIGGYLYAKAKGRLPYFHDLTRPSEDTEHVMRRSSMIRMSASSPQGRRCQRTRTRRRVCSPCYGK